MKLVLLLAFAAACSTTINPKNYATDCDADDQCTRIVVGDICSCACDLAAINVRDIDKYYGDLQVIGACRNTCIDGGDEVDASFSCGEGIGAQCTAGSCQTYALPPDAFPE